MAGAMRRSVVGFAALVLSSCVTYDPSAADDGHDAAAGVDDAAPREAGATDAAGGDASGPGADANGPVYATYAVVPSSGAYVNACTLPGAQHWLSGEDDADTVAPLPFHFHYYDVDATSAWFSSNGLVWFRSLGMDSPWDPACLGDGHAQTRTIYAFWEDLKTSVDGVCTGTTGAAPSRSFVISWPAAFDSNITDAVFSFTAILHEGTDVVELQYGPTMSTSRPGLASGAGAVIGLVGGSQQSNYFQYDCMSTGTVHDGLVLRFTPSP
jgi:hypothetical protein